MPIELPNLDNRRYQQLVDDSLARIPVHTPEWTNFNQSDPGVTLIQLFAFLTESLLYRCNQIPDRNRQKFLQLLGVPLSPAASAQGIVTFTNSRGPLETITLNEDLEVRAGSVPFRTQRGLDVLPVEAQVYFKEVRPQPPADQTDARDAYDRELLHYQQLYSSLLAETAPSDLQLYQPTPLASRVDQGVDVGAETVDQKLWIALLLRSSDAPPSDLLLDQARKAIAGKTLSLGIAPQIDATDAEGHLTPGGENSAATATVTVEMPGIPASGRLPANRQPTYRPLATFPVPTEPQVFDIILPADPTQLTIWNNLDPLEPGTNDLPPALDATNDDARVITWLRLNYGSAASAKVQWADINATFVSQRARVLNELLPTSTGEPDQGFTLSKNPVISGSLTVTVTNNDDAVEWKQISDLQTAGPEVPTIDPTQPPGVLPANPQPSTVFALDPEAGTILFGDGFHGARPGLGATIRVDYDYGAGAAGNVSANAINAGPALPAGLTVTNALRTWGGADSETAVEGEKQISRYLQHRDRLVNATDFQTITLRTPGVAIARVDVLPAYNPMLSRQDPGNAPGAVTLMVVPEFDSSRPDAPEPDQLFLKAVCDYLDPRRLVTTELFVRGPNYQSVYISVGISIVSGRNFSSAVVREQVSAQIKQFLAPFDPAMAGQIDDQTALLTTPSTDETNGWPLRRSIIAGELAAAIARVPGVAMVNALLLAGVSGDAVNQIDLVGLQLPRVDGISVTVGQPISISSLRGDASDAPAAPRKIVPVPAIPATC